MSLFNWLRPKSAPPPSTELPSDGLTVPPQLTSQTRAPAQVASPSSLKVQRQDRREHLYGVVREIMLRSEVLAAHYKFKVLSLDNHGRQFLIMVDLLNPHAVRPDQYENIEHLITATAVQRHDLQVKAVYWRLNAPPASEPTPRTRQLPKLAPAMPRKPSAFDPIDQDEVLAFKKAVATAAAASTSKPSQSQVTSGPLHQRPPLTGFEDTLLLEPEEANSPLSRTQFGDLD